MEAMEKMEEQLENRALVFIKPHAAKGQVIDFVRQFFDGGEIALSEQVSVKGGEIAPGGSIDRHYFAIAKTAVEQQPEQYKLPGGAKEAFRNAFKAGWEDALADGKLLNALGAQKRLGGVSGIELNELWKRSPQVKMAPGLYAGYFEKGGFYCINGFYPGQREVFTAPEAEVVLFEASFDPEKLDWESFRSTVIGATDPSKAKDGSLRAQILKDWQTLGLSAKPEMSRNGVHASAGPVEGLRERMVWLGLDPHSDPLARELNRLGLDPAMLDRLLENCTVELAQKDGESRKGPVFDLTEDINTSEAAALLASARLL